MQLTPAVRMSDPYSFDSRSAGWFVRPGDVVYDIGADRGGTAAMYLERGAAAVYSFEPLPANRALVPDRVRNHPAFHLLPFALSDSSGTAELRVPEKNSAASTLSPKFSRLYQERRGGEVEVVEVETRTLDELELPRAAFWKIDVEGAELEVLRGAERTLRDRKPDIVQLEMFNFDTYLYGSTLNLLARHFAHLWTLGLTAEGRLVHYRVTPRSVQNPEVKEALRRARTPLYFASDRSFWDWTRNDRPAG
ncbi:hypothetical protein GCM10017083_05460 [Thalassobaculum fulvum]|uniref:Methyltransferase FkbM domain-containing protein n=2 Tax=Thalassobaculum fulvum TaxID=1633335 RepID=A0A918XNP6_9PROT|nr:hypothetical protein GCM10017083_05460 [Thalassobaculum fulvum]